MSPTRIVFLVRSLEAGGAEYQLSLLAEHLDPEKFQVSVVCFYPTGNYIERLEQRGIRVYSLDKKGRWEVFRFFFRLVACMRRLNPEVIHSFMGPPNILAVLLRPFLPKLKIVWGVRNSAMSFADYDFTWRMTFRAERFLFRWTNSLVVNSDSGKAFLAETGFNLKKISSVANGIDTEKFQFNPSNREERRRQMGIDENTKLIALVARFDSKKDHKCFLQAAAQLSERRSDVRFLCTGTQGRIAINSLKEFSASLGLGEKVIWSGHEKNVSALLSAVDVLTSSSAYGEGFPNIVAEAMAVGVATVVTDVGDSARIVGDLGQVVPPKNPAALAEAWDAALQKPDTEALVMRENRRARIVDKFSIEKMVKNTEKIYQAL
jgi:glycosyltransferase involved in cell wall biosynthesis